MTGVDRTRLDAPHGAERGRHAEKRRRHTRALPELLGLAKAIPTVGASAAAVPVAPPRGRARTVRRGRVARSAVAVMSVTIGIVGTVALPSYAVHPSGLHAGGLRPGSGGSVTVQRLVVSALVQPADAVREAIGATTMKALEARRAKQRAEERAFLEAKRRAVQEAVAGRPAGGAVADANRTFAGGAPTATPRAAPPAPDGSIVSVARRYLGVPYVFGGASPAGFDCSGLVKYVYAQFGISLPHSSMAQGSNGIRVAEPRPGDLVVIDGGSHIGIYSGNGHMIHAPMPGRLVTERPIYTADHHFVRYRT